MIRRIYRACQRETVVKKKRKKKNWDRETGCSGTEKLSRAFTLGQRSHMDWLQWDIWVRWNGYSGIKKLKTLVIVGQTN